MENLELQNPVEFNNKGRTFIYDVNRIDVEQAELCRELAEFKKNQMNANPNTFKEVIKSGGADFLNLAISFLLLEKKSDTILEFNRDKVESEVLPFVKKLPFSELEKINWCIDNFFLNIKQKSLISEILQSKPSNDKNKEIILSKLLEMWMNPKQLKS